MAHRPNAFAEQRTGRTKFTAVQLLTLRAVRQVGSLEPAWNKGDAMTFTVGGGSVTGIRTDQGLAGGGPGIDPGLLNAVRSQLVGQDPFDTERHAARLPYSAAGASSRGSGCVDIALRDLIGKACGQPPYQLFGGAKDRVMAPRALRPSATCRRATGWGSRSTRN